MRTYMFVALTAAALLAAAPAHAQKFSEFEDNCGSAPFAPSISTDPAITDAKIDELRKDVLAFLKASDQYQDCLTKIIDGGPTFKKDDTVEKKIATSKRFETQGLKLMDDNQADKERTGDEFNKLIEARKKPAAKP